MPARDFRRGYAALLVVVLLSTTAPLASAASELIHVRAGETLLLTTPLYVEGDILIEGLLQAAPGQNLSILATGRLTVLGAISGSEGSRGDSGGDVDLRAASIVVARGARVAAGPGGHGAPAEIPGGFALAENGGEGGSVRLAGLQIEIHGVVAPGRGGDGGNAYGQQARGGDGGSSGYLMINGVGANAKEAALQTMPPVELSESALSHCSLPALQLPQASGGNGGDACAHGAGGQGAIHGLDGSDDDCTTCGTTKHPPCSSYTAAGGDNRNGERGQHGGSYNTISLDHPAGPTAGGRAVAVAGRGGDSISSGLRAGDGGNATAIGGTGGIGGDGGRGGAAGAAGDGCQGGNAGNGAPGGDALATSGAQGVNITDCTKDGAAGTVAAIGGSGGSAGTAGEGGGGLINKRHGDSGAAAIPGADGTPTRDRPRSRLCLAPGAPTILVSGNLPYLEQCSNNVHITAPDATGGQPILTYKVYINGVHLGTVNNPPQPPAIATYVHSGIQHGETFGYEVSAVTAAALDGGPKSSPEFRTADCPTLPAGAPFLTAHTGLTSGQIELRITPPAGVTGIGGYQIHRGLDANSLTYQRTEPAPSGNPPLVTYSDVGSPLTMYFYQVYAVVNGVPGPGSNVASALSSLRVIHGSGTGSITESYQASPSSGSVATHSCDNIRVTFAFMQEGFSFDSSIASEPRAAATDEWCNGASRNGTQYYTNRPDELELECEVLATPAWVESTEDRVEIGRDIHCGSVLVEAHRLNLTESDGTYTIHHTVAFHESTGGVRTWTQEATTSAPVPPDLDGGHSVCSGRFQDVSPKYLFRCAVLRSSERAVMA